KGRIEDAGKVLDVLFEGVLVSRRIVAAADGEHDVARPQSGGEGDNREEGENWGQPCQHYNTPPLSRGFRKSASRVFDIIRPTEARQAVFSGAELGLGDRPVQKWV